ncbi:MAG TPA: NUDIX hydrolase [Candidatus Paceibacterota bacterium]|nr:NUDIX hydrolase [Candidatus Paceibacterota bacterium]
MQPWEEDGVKEEHDWSSLVFCQVFPNGSLQTVLEGNRFGVKPLGYIFVIKPSRRDAKHKLPGGHRHQAKIENPLQTAQRELFGETGLDLPLDRFRYVNSEWKHHPQPHWSVLFSVCIEEAQVRDTHDMHPENEGEVPRYFPCQLFDDVFHKDDILPPHRQRLKEAGLVLFAGV